MRVWMDGWVGRLGCGFFYFFLRPGPGTLPVEWRSTKDYMHEETFIMEISRGY